MKFSEMPDDYRKFTHDFCQARSTQLIALTKEATDAVIKQVFLVNAGGAVAVLSFMGASPEARELLLAKWALVFFGVGITLVIVLSIIRYHFFAGLALGYNADLRRFFDDEIDEDELLSNDSNRVDNKTRDRLMHGAGYLAVLAFVAGAIVGACSLFVPSKVRATAPTVSQAPLLLEPCIRRGQPLFPPS
ncbi:hypothetical protein SAMN02800692_2005 [Luteibacter sp. UNC138MFCol5.1]|uniref:hypothetical protein n=1 Tax=Luteibacter sp. UNC138MFCol5.1 TaxID=1502774 RepID=UPI0008CEFFFE|nr:hypothetical protein [Luteibacter sp. UNC138MFCol5.1]SEO76545.1 hypothetical protein SAMN02800692_2005 [Luteibacter sp. UNC138MFCol5.1]